MGYKHKNGQGDVPGYGAIFMSNTGTKKECFQRKLLGLPLAQSNFVLHVKKGMILFLFEFERRQLHGVFRATSNGEIDIEPNAFKSSGKSFPAQVRFTNVWNCDPLAEHEFMDAIRDNYFSGKKFKFGLSKDQVYKLITLFHAKRIPKTHAERNFWQRDDKAAEGDARSGENRKSIRDRIRFVKQEDDHGFDVKEVDDQGYRTLMDGRAHKDNREWVSTNSITESDDFGERGSRKLEKRLNHSLGGLERVSEASLQYMRGINNENEMHNNLGELTGLTNLEKISGEHDIEDGYRRFGKNSVASNAENFVGDSISNKNKYSRIDSRIQDDYHVINGFSHSFSPHNLGSHDRGSQMIDDGGYFGHEIVEREQRTLTEHPNYEPRRSTEHPQYEPRGTDYGMKLGSDEGFGLGDVAPTTYNSLSHCNQNNSDFIPIPEVSEQFQHPFEFNNIGNTYERGFSYSTSCDPSVITMHTPYDPEVPDFCHRPYDPEVPEFCHKSSYFAPGPGSSPVDNPPFYPISTSETIPYLSENKGSDLGKFRSNKYVRKVSVFDRLTSAPKALKHEQEHESDEKDELDASVNKVMKMLEKIVSTPIKRTRKRQSTFKNDDDDNTRSNKIVDYELPSIKSDVVNIEYEGIEGGESALEETRVVDFKRRKKTIKNLNDESKEVGTESDVGMSSKRRKKLVRPVFVKKESTVANDTTRMQLTSNENVPLKVDCYSTKAVESVKNIEGQKTNIEGEASSQIGENENIPLKVDCYSTKAAESAKNIEGQNANIEGEAASSQVGENENIPLKVDCYSSTKAVESAKNIEGQKANIEGEAAASQVGENENAENCEMSDKQSQEKHAFDDMAQVESSKDDKMCGWIEG